VLLFHSRRNAGNWNLTWRDARDFSGNDAGDPTQRTTRTTALGSSRGLSLGVSLRETLGGIAPLGETVDIPERFY